MLRASVSVCMYRSDGVLMGRNYYKRSLHQALGLPAATAGILKYEGVSE
jgi:hypothetical protein